MLSPHLAEQPPLGVAVVAAAELQLDANRLAGAIRGHGVVRGKHERGRSRPLAVCSCAQTSNGPSFFATPALVNVTYFGNPFSYGG